MRHTQQATDRHYLGFAVLFKGRDNKRVEETLSQLNDPKEDDDRPKVADLIVCCESWVVWDTVSVRTNRPNRRFNFSSCIS